MTRPVDGLPARIKAQDLRSQSGQSATRVNGVGQVRLGYPDIRQELRPTVRSAPDSGDEVEALTREIVVQREGTTNGQRPHQGEARVVDQADAGRA